MAVEKKEFLHRYALPFAAWELRLYLNSHPMDRCALRLYYRLMAEAPCGNYASIEMDYPMGCQDPVGSALDCMDSAACPRKGNLDELLAEEGCRECQAGESCPLIWAWVEEPWPWDGDCTNCAG